MRYHTQGHHAVSTYHKTLDNVSRLCGSLTSLDFMEELVSEVYVCVVSSCHIRRRTEEILTSSIRDLH